MIESFHMVLFATILVIVIFVHTSQALISNSVGRFPFLMPNVHPYRVSKPGSCIYFCDRLVFCAVCMRFALCIRKMELIIGLRAYLHVIFQSIPRAFEIHILMMVHGHILNTWITWSHWILREGRAVLLTMLLTVSAHSQEARSKIIPQQKRPLRNEQIYKTISLNFMLLKQKFLSYKMMKYLICFFVCPSTHIKRMMPMRWQILPKILAPIDFQ